MSHNYQSTTVDELSLPEAAALLDMDRRTVKKLIEQGVLSARNASPPTCQKPRMRIPLEDVLALRNSYRRQIPSYGGRKLIKRQSSSENTSYIDITQL